MLPAFAAVSHPAVSASPASPASFASPALAGEAAVAEGAHSAAPADFDDLLVTATAAPATTPPSPSSPRTTSLLPGSFALTPSAQGEDLGVEESPGAAEDLWVEEEGEASPEDLLSLFPGDLASAPAPALAQTASLPLLPPLHEKTRLRESASEPGSEPVVAEREAEAPAELGTHGPESLRPPAWYSRARDLYSPRHDKGTAMPGASDPLSNASAGPGAARRSEQGDAENAFFTPPSASLEPGHTPAHGVGPGFSVPAKELAAAHSAVFAAPGSARSGGGSPGAIGEKKLTQPTLGEPANVSGQAAGTGKAKSPDTMSSASAFSAPAGFAPRARSSGSGGDSTSASASVTPAAPATPASASAGVAPTSFAATPELASATPTASALPPGAVRLIERVGEIAEQVAARPSEQVRVSLDLAGEHRVDVKVSMRGGRVFADFRTSSAEMRQALSQAWEGFARGREASAPRLAEPVFALVAPGALSSAAPTPVTASGAASDSPFSGHDAASDHQAPRRDPGAPEFALPTVRSAAASTASSPAAAAPAVPARPDSSRHLHVHA